MRRSAIFYRTFAATTALAGGAVAAATGARAERLMVRVGADAPYSECFCRLPDRQVAVGTTACLRSPDGPQLATCTMEQNVTSWRYRAERCPES